MIRIKDSFNQYLCSWSCGVLLLALLLVSLTAGARTKTKVFTFTDFGQSDKIPAPYPSEDCCICGDDIPWGIHMHSGTATFDDGLYFKDVANMPDWIQMYTYNEYNNVVRVTVNMAAADNGSGCQKISIAAGSSGWQSFQVTPYESYRGDRSNLVTQDYEFEVSTSGQMSVTFFANSNTMDVVIKSISVTYDIPDEPSLGVSVITMEGDTIPITKSFKDDVLEDGGSVKFDGKKTLILNNADLRGIVSELPEGLNIYLLGNSFVQNETELVSFSPSENGEQGKMPLTFMTNDQSPGALSYLRMGEGIEDASVLFENYDVTLKNHLGVEYEVYGGHEAMAMIAPVLEPIVDNNEETSFVTTEAEIDYEHNPGVVATEMLTNIVIDNVLYTLNDHGRPSDPDGFDTNQVVLNSEVSTADLQKAMNLLPGTGAYAETFKGLTFLLPPSIGNITVKAWSENGHQLCVKVGGQAPTVIQLTSDHATYTIPYACSEASFVYIYLPADANAPDMDGLRRIGPKSTVSGGLNGLGVSGSSYSDVPNPSTDYLLFGRNAFQSKYGGVGPGDHIIVTDKYTELENNLFLNDAAAAPFLSGKRAASLAFVDAITYVDMTATSVTGMEISRQEGPFNGLPDNIFIYMPAGNTVAPGTKNVVIADVCEDMELDGSIDAKPFDVAADFTAAKATLKRTFSQNGTGTLYLPFAISNPEAFGACYVATEVSFDGMKLSKVDYLPANYACIFKASAPLTELTQSVVQVQQVSGNSNRLVGRYNTNTSTRYCYYTADFDDADPHPSFKQVNDSHPIYPFRACVEYWTGGRLHVESDDGAITGIRELSATPGDASSSDAQWYMLDGRRLSGKPTQKGLYIHRGKKLSVMP